MPGRERETHPLAAKTVLMACRLSGVPWKYKKFLKKFKTLSSSPGEQEHANSIPLTSIDGRRSAIQIKSITFVPLYQKC